MGVLATRTVTLREKKEWTQGQLALYAKIDQAYLSRIERGLRINVGREYLQKLAHALDTTIDYLVGLADDPRPLPMAQANPIPPDVAEIAYRIQHLSHPIRERLLDSISSMLDTCDAVEEEMRRETKE